MERDDLRARTIAELQLLEHGATDWAVDILRRAIAVLAAASAEPASVDGAFMVTQVCARCGSELRDIEIIDPMLIPIIGVDK